MPLRSRNLMRRRSVRPNLEVLEGRVVLTFTPVDPTFGTAGSVIGPAADLGMQENRLTATAVAVQSDGKIVAVGTQDGSQAPAELFAERYNADGTLDTGFGTAGMIKIPIAGVGNLSSLNPQNVVIGPGGTIILAGAFGTLAGSDPTASTSVVVRLTSAGQPDSTFGTNGVAVINQPHAIFGAVAVETDGRIVAAGTIRNGTAYSTPSQATVVRLTTAGVPDTSFNATGSATVAFTTTAASSTVAGVAIDTTGRIVVAGSVSLNGTSSLTDRAFAARYNANGTTDNTFGAGGLAVPTANYLSGTNGLALDPQNEVVLVGTTVNSSTTAAQIIKLASNGSVDPNFQQATPSSQAKLQRDQFRNVAVAADGTITVVGSAYAAGFKQDYLVERFLASGQADGNFGVGGRSVFSVPAPATTSTPTFQSEQAVAVALTGSGQALVLGQAQTISRAVGFEMFAGPYLAQSVLTRVAPVVTTQTTPGDYDGDGKADLADFLTADAVFAYRPSGGGADVLQQFGMPGPVGTSIPVTGDFDGDGKADLAVYIPSLAIFAYRPSSGGRDVLTSFGTPGAGNSIPCPADYDGDGKTDLAVYLPKLGVMAYRPSSGGQDVLTAFGTAGTGGSIPAPGDYDGDGFADIAVYLPAQGKLAYRPSGGGADVVVPFGTAGVHASIPAPGDYDGDGKTDLAVYLPNLGELGYRPSSGGPDVLIPLGVSGFGNSIPAPGDYDGDGKTDGALYLPALGEFTYHPSMTGQANVIGLFGRTGSGATVPTSSITAAQPLLSLNNSGGAPPTAAAFVPLTIDLTTPPVLGATRKPTGSA